VRHIRHTAGWAFSLILAALLSFWTIKGIQPSGHAVFWILYGILGASVLVWLVATLLLRRRAPARDRSRKRVGYRGQPGSYGNLQKATFGEDLDTGIDNEGVVDASEADFK
jgi:hypothetical protein